MDPTHNTDFALRRLNSAERNALQTAARKGYLVWRADVARAYDRWWARCERTGEPFVAVKLINGHRAYVELLLHHPAVRLDPEGQQLVRAALAAVKEPGWLFGWGGCGGSHPGVPVKAAEGLAQRLLQIVAEHVRPTNRPRRKGGPGAGPRAGETPQ